MERGLFSLPGEVVEGKWGCWRRLVQAAVQLLLCNFDFMGFAGEWQLLRTSA
jgi:hypothetical protein